MNITIISLSLLIGVLTLQTFESLPALYWLSAVPFLLYLAWCFQSIRYFAISGLGFLWALSHAYIVTNPVLEPILEGKDILVTVRIERAHRDNGDYKRFFVTTVSAEYEKQTVQLPKKLLIGWMHPDLRMRA